MKQRNGELWKQLGVALLIVALNGLFVVHMVGVSYAPFNWAAYAAVYDGSLDPCTDNDGDRLCANRDPQDPDDSHFDPGGCFYDRDDGRIVPGGQITPSGPGNISTAAAPPGCYQFVSDQPGSFSLLITPPSGCFIAPQVDCPVNPTTCPTVNPADGGTCAGGVFNPNAGTLVQIGNGFGASGFLSSNACTPYFTQIQLDEDDVAVLFNNIPLLCPKPVPAPILSTWGWAVFAVCLLAIGGGALLRSRSRAA
jgi:hypothetical protein